MASFMKSLLKLTVNILAADSAAKPKQDHRNLPLSILAQDKFGIRILEWGIGPVTYTLYSI